MKKRIFTVILAFILMIPTKTNAQELEIYKVIATAYSPTGNLTYTETIPRFGVVAGKKEWLGCTMMIWFDDGDGIIKPQNFYGAFSCEDLGGSQAIKNGKVIDIFLNTYDEAIQFGAKNVIIQIIKTEG